MDTIDFGNLDEYVVAHPETKGWVVGHFLEAGSFLQSDEVEVKWAIHSKGDIKPGVVAHVTAKTLGILIRGKCLIRFPDSDKEVLLAKPGDFVTYDAGQVAHIFEALEDTTIMAIRWPSKRPNLKYDY